MPRVRARLIDVDCPSLVDSTVIRTVIWSTKELTRLGAQEALRKSGKNWSFDKLNPPAVQTYDRSGSGFLWSSFATAIAALGTSKISVSTERETGLL